MPNTNNCVSLLYFYSKQRNLGINHLIVTHFHIYLPTRIRIPALTDFSLKITLIKTNFLSLEWNRITGKPIFIHCLTSFAIIIIIGINGYAKPNTSNIYIIKITILQEKLLEIIN